MHRDEVAPWEQVAVEDMADCRVFAVERRRMRRAGPGPEVSGDFFVLRTNEWVNVVALTPEDDLVLVRQWRHGVRRVTLEIPGGLVDDGETPREAAERELFEETGYRSDDWRPIGRVDPNPAIQMNGCHTFLALSARRAGTPSFDATEECALVLRPWRDAARMVTEGEITHSLVIAALHFETLRRRRAGP